MMFAHAETQIVAEIDTVIVAGWTGRDLAAVEHHIHELAELGVKPPSTVPLFYRVSNTLLTQSQRVEVLGAETSGEVEPLLLNIDGEIWLGLGSDHTDRALEAVSVAAAKQACPKPVAKDIWRFEEVAPHLDALVLRCHIEENGGWTLYQEGTLAHIRPLRDLAQQAPLGSGGAMLCGTLGAIGGVRPAQSYRMELVDEVLNRSLRLEYRVAVLPVVD